MTSKKTGAKKKSPTDRAAKSPPARRRVRRLPTALVVEDNARVAHMHMHILEECGFQHRWAASAEQAEEMLQQRKFDLLLLDLRLPGKSGAEFLRQLRDSGDEIGVIVVTGLADIETKVSLLRMGADDFVTKPFKIADLEARISALARRAGSRRVRSLFDGALALDPASLSVLAGSLAARLTASEFGILWLLAVSPRMHVTSARILEDVFGDETGSMTGALRTTVSRLRTKLSEITEEIEVQPDRDGGYQLCLTEDPE